MTVTQPLALTTPLSDGFARCYNATRGLKSRSWVTEGDVYRLIYAEDADGNVVVRDEEALIRVLCREVG